MLGGGAGFSGRSLFLGDRTDPKAPCNVEILNFISHVVKWLREVNLVIHAEAEAGVRLYS